MSELVKPDDGSKSSGVGCLTVVGEAVGRPRAE